MKNFFCVFLTAIVFFCVFTFPVSAKTVEDLSTRTVTVEYYDDGSYGVTEVVQNAPSDYEVMATTSTVSGNKTFTYFNSNSVAIWAVRVTGTFSFTSGTSATATSAVADVYIYDSNCKFVSKSASTSGASASATASVKYIRTSMSRTVTLTCDKYGKLS